MISSRKIHWLALAFCFAATGCTAGLDEEEDIKSRDGSAYPLGTYESTDNPHLDSLQNRDFRRLMLRETAEGDRFYYAEQWLSDAWVILEGRFKPTRYEGDTYLRLLGEDGSLIARLRYRMEGLDGNEAVWLQHTNDQEDHWMRLARPSNAFCRASEECNGQGLLQLECVGYGFSCEENVCVGSCGNSNAQITLVPTTTENSQRLSNELESDHGTGDDGNEAFAFLFDVTGGPIDPQIGDALAATERGLSRHNDGIYSDSSLSTFSPVADIEFDAANDAWGYYSLMEAVTASDMWSIEPRATVLYGKLEGTAASDWFGGMRVRLTVYIAYFPEAQHLVAVVGMDADDSQQ